jgi:methylated-DNA-[protein]-cysteine S-methyltransferase
MTTDVEKALRAAAHGVDEVPPELGRAFAARADAEGLVDVAYASVDSPLGPLLAAATPTGLVALSYEQFRSRDEVLEQLATQLSPRLLEAPGRLDAARRELEEYFEGRRESFDLPLDWSLTHGFTRRVLRQTARIGYGDLSTYKEVATGAGSAGAVRAAGNALGSNPMPIVVPCHRVVRTGGKLGGYTGGVERKEFLLRLEGVLV